MEYDELETCIPERIKEEEWSCIHTQLLDYFQLSGAGDTGGRRLRDEDILSQKFTIMYEISDSLTNCLSLATFRRVANYIEQKLQSRVQGTTQATIRSSSTSTSAGLRRRNDVRNVMYTVVAASDSDHGQQVPMSQLEQEAMDALDLLECLVYNNGPRAHRCVSTYTLQRAIREVVVLYVRNHGRKHPSTVKLLVMVKHYSTSFSPYRDKYHALVDLQTLLQRGTSTCPGIDFSNVDTTAKAPIFPYAAPTSLKPLRPTKPEVMVPPAEDLLQFDWLEEETGAVTTAVDPFAIVSPVDTVAHDLADVFTPGNPFDVDIPPQHQPPPIPAPPSTVTDLVPFFSENAIPARQPPLVPLLQPPPPAAPRQQRRHEQPKRSRDHIAPSPTGPNPPNFSNPSPVDPFAVCTPTWFTPAAFDTLPLPPPPPPVMKQQCVQLPSSPPQYCPPTQQQQTPVAQGHPGGPMAAHNWSPQPFDAGVSTALVQHSFWTLPPLPSSYENSAHWSPCQQQHPGNSIDRAYDEAQWQQRSSVSYAPAVPDTPLSRLNWKYKPPIKRVINKGKQSL